MWQALKFIILSLPAMVLIVLGTALMVISLTPSGDVTVIYVGVGFAALIAVLLTFLPLREMKRRRARFYWTTAVIIAALIAYFFPPSILLLYVGLCLLILGLVIRYVQIYIEDRLTARDLMRFHVLRSATMDYAAIFDFGADQLTKSPDLFFSDRRMIEWQMRRFALPGGVAEQVQIWDDIARQVHRSVDQMDKSFRASSQGENVRVVFDIEMGGFFYTRLSSDRYLFAATLDQTTMNDNSCDRDVQNLVHALLERTSIHGAMD
jgi:hypothetical protein